ncbi:MAG: thioredoxin domain-containing protein [Actinobacteria bacterium]|nr:thioredoxin domain-containing protein [Actinomycetota bacterium]
MPNRLSRETSPYLLQHADNPVDWYPWGEEAFERARDEGRPIFLSVGYSSCHWCHVMAHESFEDDDIAAELNDRFVNVKVDREERPDVDQVYMEAVQAMTGRGGWPMSVFLTPDGEPFYAGTYWPKERRHGMPAFREVAAAISEAWRDRRDEVVASAGEITAHLREAGRDAAADDLDLSITDEAAALVVGQAWDRQLGGFGRAPKFPQAMTIAYLLDRHVRTGEGDAAEAAISALDAMAQGGIYDHVGGGFARYSTDARWLVPHFEKMLYDNGLLLAAYAQAYAVSGAERLRRVAVETADYLLREMQQPEGGFSSATDADSEGVEGRFFVWSRDEFDEVVAGIGEDADLFAAFFGVSREGNWEGTNILHEPVRRDRFAEERGLDLADLQERIDRVRAALYERRAGRVPPGLDDKVLTSWNALAIRGLALAGAWLAEDRYVEAAARTARFVEDHLVVDGALHHTWKDGRAGIPAFLEDVALLAGAYLTLYEVTGDVRWFERSVELAEDAVARFSDDEHGGYFATAHDAETLYTRPKDTWDNAQPSGNSVLAEVFAKLGAFTGEAVWTDRAEGVVRLFQEHARRNPVGYGYLLQVVERLLAGPVEVAVVGAPGLARDSLLAELWRHPRPGTVVAVATPGDAAAEVVPLLADRPAVDGRPAAYVCRGFVCDRPVTTPDELRALLEPDRT